MLSAYLWYLIYSMLKWRRDLCWGFILTSTLKVKPVFLFCCCQCLYHLIISAFQILDWWSLLDLARSRASHPLLPHPNTPRAKAARKTFLLEMWAESLTPPVLQRSLRNPEKLRWKERKRRRRRKRHPHLLWWVWWIQKRPFYHLYVAISSCRVQLWFLNRNPIAKTCQIKYPLSHLAACQRSLPSRPRLSHSSLLPLFPSLSQTSVL